MVLGIHDFIPLLYCRCMQFYINISKRDRSQNCRESFYWGWIEPEGWCRFFHQFECWHKSRFFVQLSSILYTEIPSNRVSTLIRIA